MRFDLHCHTIYSRRRDSNIKPGQLVRVAIKRKLDGLAVTDHNTFDGYSHVKRTARKIDPDFILIPGVEIGNYRFGHALILGIEELPNHKSVEEVLDFAKESDGTIVLAHPFTPHMIRRTKLKLVELKRFDGMEVFNAYDWNLNNGRTQRIAKLLKLGITAGTDCHRPREIGLAYTICEDPLKDIKKRRTSIGGFESPWSFKVAGLFGFGLI